MSKDKNKFPQENNKKDPLQKRQWRNSGERAYDDFEKNTNKATQRPIPVTKDDDEQKKN